jgi:hypothetical protein
MPSVRGVDLKRELANSPVEGLSPARGRMHRQAVDMIRDEGLLEASYSYNIVPLDQPADGPRLQAGGEMLEAARLLPDSGELTALGCGVYTLGARLESRISELFRQRRAALAVVLDEIGVELLFAMGRRVQDRMLSECYRKRLSMGAELHAGDPGLALDTQASVLRLAEGSKIGVGLHKGQLITPLKSGSVVFAVGRNLPEVAWSRCETCPSFSKCNFGRRQRDAASLPLSARA